MRVQDHSPPAELVERGECAMEGQRQGSLAHGAREGRQRAGRVLAPIASTGDTHDHDMPF